MDFDPGAGVDNKTSAGDYDIFFSKYDASHAISGTITAGGSQLSGVTIDAGAFGATTSAANGSYSFSNVAHGTNYTLSPSLAGYSFTPSTTIDSEITITNTSLVSPVHTFWNGFLWIVNVLELLNPENSATPTTIVFRDIQGEILSTSTITIPANAQRDIIINDLPGFSTSSYGIVSVDTGSNSIDGRITYYLPSSDSWTSEFNFAFSLPFLSATHGNSYAIYNTYNPSQNAEDLAYLVPTWLSIANLSAEKEDFTIRYRDQLGAEITTATLRIPPYGRRDIQAGHEFGQNSIVGIVSVEPENSDATYITSMNRYGISAIDGHYNFAFGVPTRAGNAAKMLLPVAGEGLIVLELANSSSLQNTVALTWYDQNGTELLSQTKTLAPFAQEHLIASSIIPAGDSGTVTVDGSAPRLAGASGYLYDNATGQILAEHYSEARESFGTTLSDSFNTFLSMNNWLRIGNISTSQQNAIIDYGSGVTTSVSIPAHGRRDVLIPADELNTETYGAFTLRSSLPGVLSADVVRARVLNGELDYLTVTPVR
ncbi:MAG: carboxypeptidase-like regulatory domain-containing protein [bacterium]|nr:carboxypeptidase-like regulatory domain-containing protein [bacterium]